MIPQALEEMWADVFHRLERLEARIENRKQTGTVTEVNAKEGWARVELGTDPRSGKPMLSGKIPWDEPAMGKIKWHTPPAVGEQVTVESENGEWSDARIKSSVPSDQNPRPHDKENEHFRTVGNASILEKDGMVEIKVGGTIVRITPEGVYVEGPLLHYKGPEAFLEADKTYHKARVDIKVVTEAGPTPHVFAKV